jgi:hypothetical protein
MRALLHVAGMGLFIGLVWWSLSSVKQVECEVCVEFGGRTHCAIGSGADRDGAVKSGHTPACKILANGVTESFQCSSTPPARVTCQP